MDLNKIGWENMDWIILALGWGTIGFLEMCEMRVLFTNLLTCPE
jgi:hypothetical protein